MCFFIVRVDIFRSIFFTFGLLPWGRRGKSRMCPPYPQRVVKGDEMGRFLGITVLKGWTRVGAWTGTLKKPYEMSMALLGARP